MKRVVLVFLAIGLGLFLVAGSAAAAEWHSEQPVANGIGVPAELGEVGDIEFWAPNRGLLITPRGLYAYDGTGWYPYSTVCGGHHGRIAWAGPDDFWTISDQQRGQEIVGPVQVESTWAISLCHFNNGAVTASYAEPLGSPTSYLAMDAAACSGPNDCWFAGERLPGTLNVGAFHLHWNGSGLTALPSLTVLESELEDPGRKVGSLAYWRGQPYESVVVQNGDEAEEEPEGQPALLHAIIPGAPHPFPAVPSEPLDFGGAGASATELETLHLSPDGSRLWAAAGAMEGASASPIVLQFDGGRLEQLALQDPAGALDKGTGIFGLAAEPGSNSAWVSLDNHGEDRQASVARVKIDGAVESPVLLPGPGEGISPKGEAGPVECPAAEQCWMATEKGWLFHLGSDLPQDTDPAMHVLIGFRPADASVPLAPPADLPPDDSGSERSKEEAPPPNVHFAVPKPKKKVIVGVHQRIVHKTIFQVTFTLRVPAQVRLVAKLKKKVVATTPKQTLDIGHHRLRLRLDPKRWPDNLQFEVHARNAKKAGS